MNNFIRMVRETYLFPQLLCLKRRLHKKKSSIVLLGTPIHRNLGDHLIADAEIEILRETFPKSEIIEIPTEIFFLFKKYIVPNVKSDALILISGGGWMGDVWIDDDKRMQEIINSFSNHRIIIFSQTLFFLNEMSETSQKLINDAKNCYIKCQKLTFLFRDKSSFDTAKKLYGKEIKEIILFPDLALFKKNLITLNNQKSGILLCLRDDIEQARNCAIDETITKYAKSNNLNIKYTSTIAKHAVPTWMRRILIREKLHEFGKYKLVITDRLHGMIYAYLARTNCIAIDNKTHKVSGVFNQWINPYENTMVLSEKIEAVALEDAIKKMYTLDFMDNEIDMSTKRKELIDILEG